MTKKEKNAEEKGESVENVNAKKGILTKRKRNEGKGTRISKSI